MTESTHRWRRGHVERALALLTDMQGAAAPADKVMESFFRQHKEMGSRDRGIVAEAVYAILRRRRVLSVIARGCDPAGNDTPTGLLAAYLVSEAGQSLVDLESWGFAIKFDRLHEQAQKIATADLPFAVRANLPDWLAKQMCNDFGEAEALLLANALNGAAPLDIRVNAVKTNRAEAQASLQAEGFEFLPTPYSPVGLRRTNRAPVFHTTAFKNGWFEVQDEGSQLIAALVNPKRRAVIADYCAGGGGKTLHLGALMQNTGTLYAMDIHDHRLKRLRPRVIRAGLDNVQTVALAPDNRAQVESLRGRCDGVLVDSPCSGTGTLRRNPDIKWRAIDLPTLNRQQLEILTAAAELVRAGGVLVYATCSILRCENEQIVEQFLAAHDDFRLVSPKPTLDRESVAQTDACLRGDYLAMLPHTHGTDGFFGARMEKIAAKKA